MGHSTQVSFAVSEINADLLYIIILSVVLSFDCDWRQQAVGGRKKMAAKIRQNSTYPESAYPDLLGSSGKSVDNSTKLTCLEITGYRIKYSTVLWLPELQIRRGRMV
jgi:hypothetical protein